MKIGTKLCEGVMKLSKLISIIFCPFYVFSAEVNYRIDYPVGDDYLYVYALNESKNSILIEDFFCLSLPDKFNFKVITNEGNKLKRIAMVSDGCVVGKYVELHPDGFLGRRIHIETLLSVYGFEKGTVTLSAVFCSNSRECKESNSVIIVN